MRIAVLLLLFLPRPADIPFTRHQVDIGANETCAFADLNGDGRLDIIAGENWYQAPTWKQHRFRDIEFSSGYIDNFSDLPIDVDGDGRIDVVSAAWFSKKLTWWKNPGTDGGKWTAHTIDEGFPNEFAFLVDLDNDGKASELLPQSGDAKAPLAWYELREGKFVKHVVAPNSFGHGIGAGDVNGDKRPDILTPKGWLEAPADPRTGEWKMHPAWEFTNQLGFLHVIDVNKDGRQDVLTSFAHDYGLFWLEHDAAGKFTRRVIDDSWSQGHATTLVDLNGDGQQDLLTGKRYMAHNGRDPGEREPLGIYWYEYRAGPQGVEWTRHVVDYSGPAGGGMQIPVADLDGDGDLDFAVGGKSGLYFFENQTKARKKS